MSPRLHVGLTITPERVTPDTLDSLTVEVTVRNDDTETIDTRLPSSTMLVDGKPLLSWNNAIGNGARDVRESALPPGETVRAKRVLGPALVREPGEHEAVLEVRSVRSPPARILVEPS